MAQEPFSSSGGDVSGASGVGGYAAGTGPGTSSAGGLNPALGRSSRDLASDSGPGAAPHGMLTTPGTDTETFSGDAPTRGGGDRRKTNPDVDPDTRLGLRPTTRRMVTPDLPTYPVSGTKTRTATGAVVGAGAAGAVTVLAYALAWAGAMLPPPSLALAKSSVGPGGFGPYAIGALAAVLAGAAWGAVFGLLVRRPTILKGMVFGFLPALVQWLVLSPLLGEALFFRGTRAGLFLPVLFNVLLWGGAVGHYCGRWLRPPYTGAVDPDATSAVPNS